MECFWMIIAKKMPPNREGVPKERIYQHFGSKYHVSESTVKRVIKRLSRRVTT